MDEAYKNWRQDDPRFNREEAWPEAQFPDAEYRRFRDAGCLVCALAVMLRHAGLEKEADEDLFNPWILNLRLIDAGAFTPAADLELSEIGRLYPLPGGCAVLHGSAEADRTGRSAVPHHRARQKCGKAFYGADPAAAGRRPCIRPALRRKKTQCL